MMDSDNWISSWPCKNPSEYMDADERIPVYNKNKHPINVKKRLPALLFK